MCGPFVTYLKDFSANDVEAKAAMETTTETEPSEAAAAMETAAKQSAETRAREGLPWASQPSVVTYYVGDKVITSSGTSRKSVTSRRLKWSEHGPRK